MKYPYINSRLKQEVSIPALSGGMNLRDGASAIADNQLTDVKNLWYKNGSLRTRPPFKAGKACINTVGKDFSGQTAATRFHTEINLQFEGVQYVLASNKIINSEAEEKGYKFTLGFELQAVDRNIILPNVEIFCDDKELNYFAAEMDGVIYLYLSNCTIWKFDCEKLSDKLNVDCVWEEVTEDKMYSPIVLSHCNRNGWNDFSGTQIEGYNLLTGKYKMIYSLYNPADTNSTHPMRYGYLGSLPKGKNILIEAEVTSVSPTTGEPITVMHKINYRRDGHEDILAREVFENGTAPEDGLYMFSRKDWLGFFDSNNAEWPLIIDSDEKVVRYGTVEDNLIINSYIEVDEKAKRRVFMQGEGMWFGGASHGINGGSRLFLCGNTDKQEGSLIVWSGLNNPLYFGENCYAYVGGKSKKVTAFGRQDDKLVIFKENEIYYTYYKQSSSIDASDLINQTVVDYEANSVFFPIVLLNGGIGCDCPRTIQLCRNRLVWANSNAKVYTLCTMSQYNERSVYDISEMVENKLKKYKDRLKSAVSADFDGQYVLFLGNCAFVVDYNSYGYQYVYSYSKKSDANLLIPWYFWEFPFIGTSEEHDCIINADICVLSGDLLLRGFYNASVYDKSAFVCYRMQSDDFQESDLIFENDFSSSRLEFADKRINCMLCSKSFDFGLASYYKNIEKVTFILGSNNASQITAAFISESAEETERFFDCSEFTDEKSADYLDAQTIFPNIRNVLKIAIRLECDGMLSLGETILKYRILGGK